MLTRGRRNLLGVALHIDIPTPAQLATLLDTRAPDCVSIYLPTSPLPQDADQARIEFKNLVTEAGTDNELLDDFAEDFVAWSLLAHSLAVFATPTSLRSFRLPNQLSSLVVTGRPLPRQAAAARDHVPAGRARARALAELRAPGRGRGRRAAVHHRRRRTGGGDRGAAAALRPSGRPRPAAHARRPRPPAHPRRRRADQTPSTAPPTATRTCWTTASPATRST